MRATRAFQFLSIALALLLAQVGCSSRYVEVQGPLDYPQPVHSTGDLFLRGFWPESQRELRYNYWEVPDDVAPDIKRRVYAMQEVCTQTLDDLSVAAGGAHLLDGILFLGAIGAAASVVLLALAAPAANAAVMGAIGGTGATTGLAYWGLETQKSIGLHDETLNAMDDLMKKLKAHYKDFLAAWQQGKKVFTADTSYLDDMKVAIYLARADCILWEVSPAPKPATSTTQPGKPQTTGGSTPKIAE